MSLVKSYTDEQLLSLLKSGSEAAFSEIYNRYVGSLYTYAWNILQVKEECKDAISEVFFWLWDNRRDLEITYLNAYLKAAVKFKLIRVIQKSKRREEILESRPLNTTYYKENSLELQELKVIIQQFIQKLPPRSKEIFQLSRNEHFSNREISKQLNITEKTVENQITIALRKLRKTLSQTSFWTLFF